MNTQKEAERWRGSNELSFSQHSVFLPETGIKLNEIYDFRYAMLDALKKVSIEDEEPMRLFRDAWCAFDSLQVSGEHGQGKMSVIAVGGYFFDFHPLTLLSGYYISEDDFMHDKVVLDNESAWLLFGSSDITGMTVNINGKPFVVAGVVELETDYASKLARGDSLNVFMSFDAYCTLTEKDTAVCYELVMPEPVEGFGDKVIEEKFPVGNGIVINNSSRFEMSGILYSLKNYFARNIHNKAVAFPYWENAARINENRICVISFFCIIAVFLVILLIAVQLYLGYIILQSARKQRNDSQSTE